MLSYTPSAHREHFLHRALIFEGECTGIAVYANLHNHIASKLYGRVIGCPVKSKLICGNEKNTWNIPVGVAQSGYSVRFPLLTKMKTSAAARQKNHCKLGG